MEILSYQRSVFPLTAKAVANKACRSRSDLDWEGQRANIKRFYLQQKKELEEVRDIMSREYNFHAT